MKKNMTVHTLKNGEHECLVDVDEYTYGNILFIGRELGLEAPCDIVRIAVGELARRIRQGEL